MRVPCTACGSEILQETFSRTGGLCMACKQGIRKSIEETKLRERKAREYSPWKALWSSLVKRVYDADAGFDGLSSNEKIFYTLRVLEGEVYNGGIGQFFYNSSGAHYQTVVQNLKLLQAETSLDLLLQAKAVLYGETEPPTESRERRERMRHGEEVESALSVISEAYWKNPDKLGEKLDAFAERTGLLTPFLRPPINP